MRNRVAWGLVVLASELVIWVRWEDGREGRLLQQMLLAQGVAGTAVLFLTQQSQPHPCLRPARALATGLVALMVPALGGLWLGTPGHAFCGGEATLVAPAWTFPVQLIAVAAAGGLVLCLQPLRQPVLLWTTVASWVSALLALYLNAVWCL